MATRFDTQNQTQKEKVFPVEAVVDIRFFREVKATTTRPCSAPAKPVAVDGRAD
jgi:hypothetical protein